jgi:hypothetical protein
VLLQRGRLLRAQTEIVDPAKCEAKAVLDELETSG